MDGPLNSCFFGDSGKRNKEDIGTHYPEDHLATQSPYFVHRHFNDYFTNYPVYLDFVNKAQLSFFLYIILFFFNYLYNLVFGFRKVEVTPDPQGCPFPHSNCLRFPH